MIEILQVNSYISAMRCSLLERAIQSPPRTPRRPLASTSTTSSDSSTMSVDCPQSAGINGHPSSVPPLVHHPIEQVCLIDFIVESHIPSICLDKDYFTDYQDPFVISSLILDGIIHLCTISTLTAIANLNAKRGSGYKRDRHSFLE